MGVSCLTVGARFTVAARFVHVRRAADAPCGAYDCARASVGEPANASRCTARLDFMRVFNA
jgi:hypothetical protein